MALRIGSRAPKFTLRDRNNKAVTFPPHAAASYVIYFYPRDSTPGCTIEAVQFTKLLLKFRRRGTVVVGISGGDAQSKAIFCGKNRLKHLLLSDPDFSISKKFGVYGRKVFMGRTFHGIKRTTFVLDARRRIVRIFKNVKANGHADEVLTFLNDTLHTRAGNGR